MDISGLTISAITLVFRAFSLLLISLSAPITTVTGKDYRELSTCFRYSSMAYKVKNYTKLVSTSSSSSSKRVTITAVNDDDYGSESNSKGCELLPELD
jgi:hypothetical protein